ncbi:hypothetical protein ACWCXH_29440 [Kitasatospora sp. NPDC001660]
MVKESVDVDVPPHTVYNQWWSPRRAVRRTAGADGSLRVEPRLARGTAAPVPATGAAPRRPSEVTRTGPIGPGCTGYARGMEDYGPPADDLSGGISETLDLCDLCGRAVAHGDLLSALVPDSSALHATDPELDGERVLTACTVDHLAALTEQYRHRPFVPEEQWAGKVCRALADYDDAVPLSMVAALSGLSVRQAARGVEWHNARAREWRARYGDPGDDRQ